MESKIKQYYNNINFFINKHKQIRQLFNNIYDNTFNGFLFSIIILSIYNLHKSTIIKSDYMYYFILGVDLVIYALKNNELQKYYNMIILLFSLTFKYIDNEQTYIIYMNSILEYLDKTIQNNIETKNALYSFCSLIFVLICQLTLDKELYKQNYTNIKYCGECLGNIINYYEHITDNYEEYIEYKTKVYEILYNLNLMTKTTEDILKQIDNDIIDRINNND